MQSTVEVPRLSVKAAQGHVCGEEKMGLTLVQMRFLCYAIFITSVLGDEKMDSSKSRLFVAAANREPALHVVGCGFTVGVFLVLLLLLYVWFLSF